MSAPKKGPKYEIRPAMHQWHGSEEPLASAQRRGRKAKIPVKSDGMNSHNASQPWHHAEPLVGVALQVQEVYPFHDGWNVACFVILLLFVLTVVSLAVLAFLYELLDCGCCAKGKTARELREEPGTFSAMDRFRNHRVEVV